MSKKDQSKRSADQSIELDFSTKGKRLRYLRELAHLERSEMAAIARVAYVTYKDWENSLTNLPDRRARWVVDSLLSRGLNCSVQWLLDGVGELPERQQLIWDGKSVFAHEEEALTKYGDNHKQIMTELEFFCNKHSDSIGLVVSDSGMLPAFAVDDVVAGIQFFKQNIDQALGLNCIVKLENDATLLRNLYKGRELGLYTLFCANPNTPSESRILHDVKLISAAPVIWHRTQMIPIK